MRQRAFATLLRNAGRRGGRAAALRQEPARACRTPVYRYAMYNWDAAPLRFFYFHPGPSGARTRRSTPC